MRGHEVSVRLSIIIPFHRNLAFLEQSLAGLQPLPPGADVLIVADGAVDDCERLAARYGARVLAIPGPSGPAIARNRGACEVAGDVLVFVDADVVAGGEDLARLTAAFDEDPDLAAVFGAYDETPAEPNLVSQYKNLAHSFIHQSSQRDARTFWAGFGAIRRKVFIEVGGFDERYPRPCIEDIELGYRLTSRGYRIRLDAGLRVCHLKKWTFVSLVVADIRDRGIPWTQLILRSGHAHDDLNLRSAYRVSVVLSYVLVMLVLATPFVLPLGLAIPFVLAALYWLNRSILRFFHERRGLWFTLRIAPIHLLYHLYNGVSFGVGSAIHYLNRWLGVRLPGATPLDEWQGPLTAGGGRRAEASAQRADRG